MSARRQLLIAAAVAVGVTIAFFFLLLGPKLSQIGEIRDEVEAARDQQSSLEASIRRLEEIRREAPTTRRDLARIQDLLPGEPQLPTFIRLLQQAALRDSVDLVSIAPSEPSLLPDATEIQQVNVTVVVVGTFHTIENFLARIENLRRLLEVQSIAVTPTREPTFPGEIVPLNAQLSMRMFVVGEDASLDGGSSSSSSSSSSSDERATVDRGASS